LDFKLDPKLESIRADRAQVEQILLNLVVNARDAIHKRSNDESGEGDEGVISIRTSNSLEKGRIILEISDNGCGMTEEVRARAFDPFFTTKGVGRGTGLGLASVYGILQQAGGAISIESEVGKGTTFRVEFPMAEVKKSTGVPLTAERLEGTKGLQILVAEDDTVIRTLIKRNLSSHHHEVVDVEDGAQAWKAYQERSEGFDLVITDLLMPEMGGIELSKKIRAKNPSQVILCVSGYSNEDTGGLPLLHKPFTAKKLIEKIASLTTIPQP
jgi:CheY-like chemotaxis protein